MAFKSSKNMPSLPYRMEVVFNAIGEAFLKSSQMPNLNHDNAPITLIEAWDTVEQKRVAIICIANEEGMFPVAVVQDIWSNDGLGLAFDRYKMITSDNVGDYPQTWPDDEGDVGTDSQDQLIEELRASGINVFSFDDFMNLSEDDLRKALEGDDADPSVEDSDWGDDTPESTN